MSFNVQFCKGFKADYPMKKAELQRGEGRKSIAANQRFYVVFRMHIEKP